MEFWRSILVEELKQQYYNMCKRDLCRYLSLSFSFVSGKFLRFLLIGTPRSITVRYLEYRIYFNIVFEYVYFEIRDDGEKLV